MAKKKKKPQRRASSLRGRQKQKIRPHILIVIVLVLVLGGVVWWYRQTALQPEDMGRETERQEEGGEEAVDAHYLSATFSDSFSSLAWLDDTFTTLYFDQTGTNLLFPPDIVVEEMTTSSLLDTFVPELVQQTKSTVVFVGHHLRTDQKAVMVGDRDNDTWTQVNFDTLGISHDQTIISIYPIPLLNQWIIFTKAEQTNAFHVYTFDSDMTHIDDADLGTIPQGVSLTCDSNFCLIYYADSLEFFMLDMASLELTRAQELQDMVREKNIDSVVMQHVNYDTERWVVGLTHKKAFEIWQYAPFASGRDPLSLIFSQELEYPGHLALLARADGRIFILWASYFTHAYEITPPVIPSDSPVIPSFGRNDKKKNVIPSESEGGQLGRGKLDQLNLAVADLSARFGWRISKNSAVQLHELSNAIYIINSEGTMVRFDGEINTRIDNIFWFNFTPHFVKIIPAPSSVIPHPPVIPSFGRNDKEEVRDDKEEVRKDKKEVRNSGLVVVGVPDGGTKIYGFTDYGVEVSAIRQVVSKQINFEVATVGAAQISGLESGGGRAQIEYFLSNDGGARWKKAEMGTVVKFKNQGNDLRWKIKISPYKNTDPYKTPYLRSINLVYWYEK
ncbi:hypothetical protein MYX06_03480 [Patescibacteria group bacterium AH-259-L05]|nr:hypothetical protein [Patescibacteria group bacterium AH-259-L05]